MTMTLGSGQVALLFLVLLRCTGLVIAAPLFGHRTVPAPVKAGFVAALTVGVLSRATDGATATQLPLIFAAPIEIGIGLALGFLISLGFFAIEMIGRLLSLQMGLSLSAVFNPTTEEGGTALDPVFAVLAGLLFLALDLHVATVQALAHSFEQFPLGGGWPAELPVLGAQLTALALELGVRVGMPLALVLLMSELAIALLARAIPQINVFIFGLPVKLLIGTVVTAVAMPSLARGAASVFQALFRSVNTGVLP
jgi:flagellar biosynthesis protein FliR